MNAVGIFNNAIAITTAAVVKKNSLRFHWDLSCHPLKGSRIKYSLVMLISKVETRYLYLVQQPIFWKIVLTIIFFQVIVSITRVGDDCYFFWEFADDECFGLLNLVKRVYMITNSNYSL